MDIKNKIAVVTGASSGLGVVFSEKLVEKGATVYGLARRLNKLKDIQTRLGSQFIPVQMDITHADDIEKWVKEQFSGEHLPDILINNAGLGIFGDVDELSVDDWKKMVDTNLNGVFYLTRAVVPLMKKKPRHNHIINIASIAGKIGNPNLSGYNASKFGVGGFSDALFKELRYDKIKVSCMYPGSISTNFSNRTGRKNHSNKMPAGDVADTLIYLLETPDNFLIDEITMRPLNPKNPDSK